MQCKQRRAAIVRVSHLRLLGDALEKKHQHPPPLHPSTPTPSTVLFVGEEGGGNAPDRSARLDATGGLGHGVYFPGGGFMPCDDDDEDNCDFGSGDLETSVFSPAGPDSKSLIS
jgi:hypothetical protein